MRFLQHARHIPTWNHLTQYIFSTLTPSVDGAMHQLQVVFEEQQLSLRKYFVEDIPPLSHLWRYIEVVDICSFVRHRLCLAGWDRMGNDDFVVPSICSEDETMWRTIIGAL